MLTCAATVAGIYLGAALSSAAHAQSTTIVALGGSNTRGKGVSSSQAWPARLEVMLMARGIKATVINAGVDGDTSRGMLARMDWAVPAGTKVVILHPSGRNDQRRGVADRSANIAEMKSRLAARKIVVVMLDMNLLRAEQSPPARWSAYPAGRPREDCRGYAATCAGGARQVSCGPARLSFTPPRSYVTLHIASRAGGVQAACMRGRGGEGFPISMFLPAASCRRHR
jgi:acyl-CoA thioesterase-1